MGFGSFKDVIGSAVVEVVGDASKLHKDLKNAFDKSIKSADSTGRKIGKALSIGLAATIAGATAAGIAIFKLTSDTAKYGDELAKTAQKTGISVEALSKLRFAGELADVEFGELAIGVKFLSSAISDVLAGASNDGTKALEFLDGRLIDLIKNGASSEDVFLAVADGFSKMEDGAIKTDLALKIFGRSGQNMIPLLNEGAAGLKAMGDEAERAGRVMSTESAKASEAFNDSLTRLKASVDGVKNSIGVELIPAMTGLVLEIRDWVDENRELLAQDVKGFLTDIVTIARALGPVLAFAARETASLAKEMANLLEDIEKFNVPALLLRLLPAPIGALFLAKSRAGKTVPGAAEGGGGAGGAGTVGAGALFEEERVLGEIEERYKKIFGEKAKGKEVTDSLNDSLKDQIEALTKEIDTFGMTGEAVIKYEANLLRAKGAQEELVAEWEKKALLQAAREQLEEINRLLREQAVGMSGMWGVGIDFMITETRRGGQAISDQISEMNQFLIQGARNMQTTLANTLGDAFRGEFKNIGQAFADLVQNMLAELIAFKITTALFGADFGTTGKFGGLLGRVGTFFKGLKFAEGGIAPGGFKAFQHGGVVTKPTLGLVGEGRYPEAIIPMKGGSVPVELHGMERQQKQGDINIIIPVNTTDPVTFEQYLRRNKGAIQRLIVEDILANGAIIQSTRRAI